MKFASFAPWMISVTRSLFLVRVVLLLSFCIFIIGRILGVLLDLFAFAIRGFSLVFLTGGLILLLLVFEGIRVKLRIIDGGFALSVSFLVRRLDLLRLVLTVPQLLEVLNDGLFDRVGSWSKDVHDVRQ